METPVAGAAPAGGPSIPMAGLWLSCAASQPGEIPYPTEPALPAAHPCLKQGM